MENENCNRFIINFPKEYKHKGINVSWATGNRLMAHACDFEKDTKTGGNKRRGLKNSLHEITWDLSMHGLIGRKLVNESHQLFRIIQEVSPETTASIERSPVLVKFSRKYRSILEACILEAKEHSSSKMKGKKGAKEFETQMKILKIMELIWSLCELLFVEKLLPGTILLYLLKWCTLHFPEVDDRIHLLTEDIGSNEPHTHPEYWNAFLSVLLQGRMTDAQNLLSMHPKYQTVNYDPFSSLDELIRKMPIFTANLGQSVGEFEMKWKHWQAECRVRLQEGDFDTYKELKLACRILCGEEQVFNELKHLTGTWYHMLISMLFYTQPMVTVTELQHCCKRTVDCFGGEGVLGPLDQILLSAFELDIYKVIKECSEHLSNWWLSAHLTDLLYHCGLVTQRSLNFGTNLRESLLVEYAISLASHESLWLVVADYLYACPENGLNYLNLFIERIPLTSEKKASKVLRLCEKMGLIDLAQTICRQMAVRALKQNRLGCALTWSLRSNNNSFTVYISNKLLKEYSQTGEFAHVDLLDYLGTSVLASDRLTFLGKYREFHKLLEKNEIREAAELLLNLLISKMAPMDFWPILFDNAIPLLEGDEIIYNSKDTSKFLALLNMLDQNKATVFCNATELAMEKMNQKIENFRTALIRNLSMTLVNFEIV